MNEDQSIQRNEDEIDLKELFMILWKRKKIIVSFTLIAALLSGMFSMFILSPVYDAKLNIVISMPEKYITNYGEYVLPISTNEQYINLITSNDVLSNTIKAMGYNPEKVTYEKLREKISIAKSETIKMEGAVQNSFEITVSAGNPEESAKLAKTLYDNYMEFMDVMTKDRAISYFYNDFSVKLKSLDIQLASLKQMLKKNEELLAQTPQTINQKEAMQAINGNISDYVVLENIINENYTKIENDIILNKQNINTIEDTKRVYYDYLKELDKEKLAIAKYYETGRATKLESTVIGVIETSIYLPSPPAVPSQKTSPRNAINIAVGAVIGGMIGVMTALVKEYWCR